MSRTLENDLQTLRMLQSIKNAKAEAELAGLKQQETEIRGHLDRLQTQKQAVWEPDDALQEMRSGGSDLHWYSWVENSHRNVLIELAKLKSRMDRLARLSATEHARKTVLSNLHEGAVKTRALEKAAKDLQVILDMSVIRKPTHAAHLPGSLDADDN